MIVVLSGEGPSDLGQCANEQRQCRKPEFVHGPMTYLVDKIIEGRFNYSLLDSTPQSYIYISEQRLSELEEIRKGQHRKVSLVGKKRDQETGYFYINAWMLGEETLRLEADENDRAIAVLFRDADGTRSTVKGLWAGKHASMIGGFDRSKLGQRGVPMLPKPKSEAWMLCAAKPNPYQNCAALEDLPGNDDSPNSAKLALDRALNGHSSTQEQLNWLEQNGFDHSVVADQMPSFSEFSSRLQIALEML